MRQWIATLIILLVSAQLFPMRHYWQDMMFHLSWGLIPLFGLWIALNFFAIAPLAKHENPTVASIANVYTHFFAYTLLYQACLLMTLVFYVFGSAVMGESQELFRFDWEYGMAYSTWITYGIGCLMIFYAESKWFQFIIVVLLSWGGVGAFFFYETEMRDFAVQHPHWFNYGFMASQLLLSVMTMGAILGLGGKDGGGLYGREKKKKKAKS